LFAAYKFVNDGHNVIIIEKMPRLGGRIHTIYDSQYHYEAGAGRINLNHKNVVKLINTFNLSLVPLSKTKTYRSVATGSVPVRNVANARLTRVCKAAETVSADKLRSITFKQLCFEIIGEEQTHHLISEFGYNAEFETMNAADAVESFKNDFAGTQNYYVVKEGLSELVNRLESLLLASGRVKIYKECEATSIKYNRHYKYMKVVTRLKMDDTRVFKSDVVVCGLPKNELQTLMSESMDDKQYGEVETLLDSVATVPLHRVYGKFNHNWFHKIPVTTTDDPIRQFIPVNSQHAIAMVAYGDTTYADYWNGCAQQGDRKLRTALLEHLHVVFPDVKLPRMQWVQNYYWQTGVHVWKAGVDSNQVMQRVGRLMGEDTPFFVIGEAYSKHQSWIEGGLCTVEDMYPAMKKYVKNIVHDGVRLPTVKKQDVPAFMAANGYRKWVMLRTNGKLRLLNAEAHGDVFGANLETDTTTKMPINCYKNYERKEFKSDVMTMIHNITVAFVDESSRPSLRQ
jgi:monoamine oxidase